MIPKPLGRSKKNSSLPVRKRGPSESIGSSNGGWPSELSSVIWELLSFNSLILMLAT